MIRYLNESSLEEGRLNKVKLKLSLIRMQQSSLLAKTCLVGPFCHLENVGGLVYVQT